MNLPVSRFPLIAACAIAVAFSLSLPPMAKADPPPWAPAHGWREKHHGHHDDEEDEDYRAPAPAAAVMPYGLDQRVCNRDLVGAALGGAAGGLIGSNIGKSSGKTAATVGGVLLGMFVGGSIGRSMDRVDQACTGQVLEHVPDNQTVVWQGQNQQGYWVTPVRSYDAGNGRYCREYQSVAAIGGQRQQTYGTACRQPDGSWQIVN